MVFTPKSDDCSNDGLSAVLNGFSVFELSIVQIFRLVSPTD